MQPDRSNVRRARTNAVVSQPPVVERLEGRALFAAHVAADPAVVDGTLVVDGTNKSDVIVVSLDANDFLLQTLVVTVNDQAFSFKLDDAAAPLTAVRIAGGNGHDVLSVDETNGPITMSVTLLGGNGKDTLTGASGADTLDGGNGKDVLDGRAGVDSMSGGRGKDAVTGGLDVDTFEGDSAAEVVDLAADESVSDSNGNGGGKKN